MNSLSDPLGDGAIEEAEIVADVVREHRLQLGADDLPVRSRGNVPGLDQHRGRHITKDEVTVTVLHVVVAGAHFGADHQHRTGVAGADVVGSGLDPECG